MTTPAAADTRVRRHRLWSSWLWILAAILGVGSIWTATRVVHDTRLRRETVRLLAQDKAIEIAGLASARFERLVMETFAPGLTMNGRLPPQASLAAIRTEQSARIACRCRPTLPISDFFRFESESPSAIVSTAPDRVPILSDSVIATFSRAALAAADSSINPVTRLYAGPEFKGLAIVTVVERERSTTRAAVYGAVLPARAIIASLFDPIPRGATERLARLDSLSLAVTSRGDTLFGALASGRQAASYRVPGSLSDLTVVVALGGRQAAMAMLMPVAHDRLWINGLLVLTTILVIVFAVGSSRREVLLARARSDFIAGVSHDLRLPLAQIILAGETLALGRDRNQADRDALTGSILREARRLGTLVENVLLVSRTGAVALKPHLQSVDVANLFTEVVEAVHLAIEDAGHSIEANAGQGRAVVADRGLLRQALVNLVDNSIKYGKPGQRIRLTSDVTPVNRVTIEVEDEGSGIPAAERNRLFEPYERLGRDQTSERTGSGLGLAVVRQVVLACGGSVRIDDGSAGGTRVVIELAGAGRP